MDAPPVLIVGAGPTGLTLAWYFATRLRKRVLVIERERTLGGCHRVERVEGRFTEHSPRIYLDNYLNFSKLLSEMGISWEQIFAPYPYSYFSAIGPLWRSLSWRELFYLALLAFRGAPQETVGEYLETHEFSYESRELIDAYCRLTDGAGVERYTTHEFSELLNRNAFYKIWQPKEPNDLLLFPLWEKALRETGLVEIWRETELISLEGDGRRATVMRDGFIQTIDSSRTILAIPPRPLAKVLANSASPRIKGAFGPLERLKEWSEKASYDEFLGVALSWERPVTFPTEWSAPIGPWKIVASPTQFSAGHLLSCVITDSRGTRGLDESAIKRRLTQEVCHALHLPDPDQVTLYPLLYIDRLVWRDRDTAFMLTPAGYIAQDSLLPGLHTCGPHTGRSVYPITTLEAAVENAIHLVNDLLENPIEIKEAWTLHRPLRWAVWAVVSLVVIWGTIRYLLPNGWLRLIG